MAQKVLLDLSDEKLPEFLHFEILLRLNTKELIKNCTLVSKKWNSILAQTQFWIQKCEYDGHNEALPPVHLRQLPFNYKKICLKNPFGRNLIQAYPNQLKNPRNACRCEQIHGSCSDKDFGGDPRWIYQQKQRFSHEIPPFFLGHEHFDKDFDFNLIDSCLATSNCWSSKEIMIDLLKEGFDEFVLDQLRPTITISEYVAHRADCGAIYHMEAYLLTKNKKLFQNLPPEMVTRFETRKTFAQWESQKWVKIEHCFKKYPIGVRYILFKSDGKDLQWWVGHYGSKMAKPSVVVHYEFNNMPDELKTDAEKSENPCSGTMDVEDRDGNAETSKNKKEEGEQEEAEEQEEDFDDADNGIDLPHNLWNDAPPEPISLQQSRRVFRGNHRRRGNGFRTLRNLIGRNPP
uniref:FBA domain-containing protein n=1 Tax=Acrobeloides nanus TaxID=290746 RepID=A0A914DS47_9BILA